MSNFSEQLAELMSEDNYNQTSLSKSMNTSNSKLSLYLSDKAKPKYEFFINLIEFFNCSADFLVGLTDFPKRDISYKPVQPFSTRLKAILKDKNISQYSFIKDTKISWSIFHAWLSDNSLPSIDNLIKVANYLDCSIDYLLGRED